MAIDLFSIILTSATSWGVGRILDVVRGCVCGGEKDREVENQAFNDHVCGRCGRSLTQYTNATSHTTNRNGSIASAHISNIRFPKVKKLLNVHFDLDVVNSKHEDMVAKATLSEFNGSVIDEHKMVFHPRRERWRYKKMTFVLAATAQLPEKGCVIAVDFKAYNLWGDLLYEERKLGKYWGKYSKHIF